MVLRKTSLDKIHKLLTDTVLSVCSNTVQYEAELVIEGLLGITVDNQDVVLVNIKELISQGTTGDKPEKENYQSMKHENVHPSEKERKSASICEDIQSQEVGYESDEDGDSIGSDCSHEEPHQDEGKECNEPGPLGLDTDHADAEKRLHDCSSTGTLPEPTISIKKEIMEGEQSHLLDESMTPTISNEDQATDSPAVLRPQEPTILITMENGKKVFNCSHEGCSYQSKTKGNLRRHFMVHIGGYFHCDKCPSKFCDAGMLRGHVKRKHGDEPLICDFCGKSFTSRQGLYRHKSLKHDEKHINPHTCHICFQSFFDKNSYTGHVNMHMDNREFICKICNKGFYYRSNLNRHMTCCSGQGKIKCDQCDTVLSSQRSLQQHMEGKHAKQQHTCSCGKVYDWKISLYRHQKSCMSMLNLDSDSVCDEGYSRETENPPNDGKSVVYTGMEGVANNALT